MKAKAPAVLLCVMIIMAAVAVPTAARRRGRKNCSGLRAGTGGVGCNNNVSFFKRILEEKLREQGDDDAPEMRGEDLEEMLLLRELLQDEDREGTLPEVEDEPEPEAREETGDLEEKIRLLSELLTELQET